MKWYYSIKGNVTEHGVAEDIELADLIRQAGLKESDLVCSEATGNKWIPVSAAAGPIDSAAPPPLRLASREPSAKPVVRLGSVWRRAFWIVLALATGLLLGVLLLRGEYKP
jgi:hypothetical protein